MRSGIGDFINNKTAWLNHLLRDRKLVGDQEALT